MTTKVYNKLVRDKIPMIIVADGHECIVQSLDLETYREELKKKLVEESKEASESRDVDALIEELADIMEVIYALRDAYGRSAEDLEIVRMERCSSRGGFENRLFLHTVTNHSE